MVKLLVHQFLDQFIASLDILVIKKKLCFFIGREIITLLENLEQVPSLETLDEIFDLKSSDCVVILVNFLKNGLQLFACK